MVRILWDSLAEGGHVVMVKNPHCYPKLMVRNFIRELFSNRSDTSSLERQRCL